jgi:hypothetical protein
MLFCRLCQAWILAPIPIGAGESGALLIGMRTGKLDLAAAFFIE